MGLAERLLADLRLATVFLTRLPLPPAGVPEGRTLADAAWCFPLAGLAVGALSAAVFALALWVGLAGLPAAVLALGAGVLATGALHEDGLADMADGFGGGWTREAKLEIMRDSRLGSFGAVALAVSLLLRAAALAQIADAAAAAAALLAAHAGGRALLPAFMATTPLARSDGQSAAAGRPTAATAACALGLGLAVLAAASWAGGFGAWFLLASALLLTLTFLAVRALARRQIGGYTGDVLGGAEQCAEIAVLLAAAALFS